MTEVALGLGANLGDAVATLHQAIAALHHTPALTDVRVSSLYVTRPVGGVEQPDFINAVVVASTDLSPHDILALAQSLENEHGRTRDIRWGPRTLDVDVLALGEVTSDDPQVLLPHPRAHERAFVLVPWAEVAPDALLVGHGSVAQCLADLPAEERAGVRIWQAPS